MAFMVTSLVTAALVVVVGRPRKLTGLIMHAVGLLVLAVVQFGLGEMGGLVMVHIILGLLIGIGAIALYPLAARRLRPVTEAT